MKKQEGYQKAKERANHPEGKDFRRWFKDLLYKGTKSCFERDILRNSQDVLWEEWKKQAESYDRRNDEIFSQD